VTYKVATLVHKCVNGRAPEYLAEFCHPSVDRSTSRNEISCQWEAPRTAHADVNFGDRSFAVDGPVHAPGTIYLTQSENRLGHSQCLQNC